MKPLYRFSVILFFAVCLIIPKAMAYEEVLPGDSLFLSAIHLDDPVKYREKTMKRFSYTEIPVYVLPNDSLVISLYNGYAKCQLINTGCYEFCRDDLYVRKIDVVFTKYPLHKEQWRTNYYDLLAWRLKALFELDPSLNNPSIEWGLILQTAATNEPDAKKLFHGIVLHLEPIAYSVEITEEEYVPSQREFTPIENGGFLFREQRNPDMFRSRYNFEPIPGREPRRNMDPSDLKCPRWR